MFNFDWTMILVAVVVIQLFCIARTLAAVFAWLIRPYKRLNAEPFQKADVEPWEGQGASQP